MARHWVHEKLCPQFFVPLTIHFEHKRPRPIRREQERIEQNGPVRVLLRGGKPVDNGQIREIAPERTPKRGKIRFWERL
jgi:energy-converting hydrogenase Eha subunit F